MYTSLDVLKLTISESWNKILTSPCQPAGSTITIASHTAVKDEFPRSAFYIAYERSGFGAHLLHVSGRVLSFPQVKGTTTRSRGVSFHFEMTFSSLEIKTVGLSLEIAAAQAARLRSSWQSLHKAMITTITSAWLSWLERLTLTRTARCRNSKLDLRL